jgi:hypothetical protein
MQSKDLDSFRIKRGTAQEATVVQVVALALSSFLLYWSESLNQVFPPPDGKHFVSARSRGEGRCCGTVGSSEYF